MDEYLSVLMNDSLTEMKESFIKKEKKQASVVEEKEKFAEEFNKNVQLIKVKRVIGCGKGRTSPCPYQSQVVYACF